MQQPDTTSDSPTSLQARPRLIFFTEPDGAALHQLINDQGLFRALAESGHGIALAIPDFTDGRAELVRQLKARSIYVVAWLLLPPGEGLWLNLQNYPQVVARYRAFRDWVRQQHLTLDAIGLDVEPPASEVSHIQQWGLRDVVRRAWLARENVLYPAARATYVELIAEMHHDGYEVHTYQLPLLADDRRVGTTLIQRALDIVDLPADVEVLMCYSSLPVERLGNDLGGALIASYGPNADAIGIGSMGGGDTLEDTDEALPPLDWEACERDLLLAARHTDTIYIFSLEGCMERGLLPRLAAFDWDREAAVPFSRRALVGTLRSGLLLLLITIRFSRVALAWLGWLLAIVLFVQQVRRWRQTTATTLATPPYRRNDETIT
ncbi:MAG: hypothetical protein MUD01_00400 [Chloroflexaceae bacterium]|nr:hypothetical protein [Chloroflexaceae bacterium]